MSKTEKLLRFDQVVHGYRDGHRQLAGSLMLDVEAADIMALASDMLTSRGLRADEDYITAYPLKGENKYVFARTWPAPEMSRPGCVWTHSLVFDYLTVSKIEDADFIRSLFRRPTVGTLSTFGTPLTIDVGACASERIDLPEKSADDAVRRMYSMRWAHGEIVLYSQGVEIDVQTAFAIWSQMPPRLRRTTALCTESSASRLPVKAELTFRFASVPALPSSYEGNDGRRTSDTFRGMRLLAKDLARDYTTPLRKFLRRYSVDVAEPLDAMVVLAQAFLLLREAQHPDEFFDLAKFLGIAFTNPRDAQLLKQELLLGRFFEGTESADRRANSFLGTLRAIDRQEMALTLPDEAQFVHVFQDVAASPSVFAAVVELDGNAGVVGLVESCVRQALDIIPLGVIATLEVSDQCALLFARIRPQLLRESGFWSTHAPIRKLLLELPELDAESASCFLEVFRESLEADELQLLLERVPETVVASVAAFWENDMAPPNVSRLAVQQLGSLGDLLSRTLRRTRWLPRSIWADVGHALGSHPDANIDPAVWAGFLQTGHVSRLERNESTLAALLFVEAGGCEPSIAKTLLSVSFDLLYVVAWDGHLSLEEQRILGGRLPGGSTYWSWDYCKRLTRACLDALTRTSSWRGDLLEMNVSSMTAEAVMREIASRDDSLAELKALSLKLGDLPDARRVWEKAVKDALRQKARFRPIWW
ncbi:hypothetical protein [Burkholderia thailandensis]|uniref:GAP1-N1 domain-containing protein n=1 Tax=Burkholderia thailandensis TaxID=57975 RepID=UPI001EE37B1A|nr:hypothetical protein [Burkholderia thailandensis]MCS6516555.1 hypothetical protein [Burkholderia thailandensis]